MKKIWYSCFVLTFMFLAFNNALACICHGPEESDKDFTRLLTKTITEEFNKSTIVFEGKVIAAEYVPSNDEIYKTKLNPEVLIIKLKFDKWWKGKVEEEVILSTDRARFFEGEVSNSCDYGFTVGKTYLVYASGKAGKLKANYCSTKQIQNAERDIEELRKIRRTRKEKAISD